MSVEFKAVKINLKYVAVAGLVVAGLGYIRSSQPLDYEFSSVYDGDKHHVLVHTDTNNSRYNERCADEVSANLLKAKITNYDIQTVNDGEYELIYYNGNKIK